MNTYYGDLCTKVYESDKSLARNKEVDFYLSFVKDKNMKVLEPMCGNGRMLIPFMLEGIHIDGFDLSEHMLKVCQMKARKLNLSPNVFTGKIENFKADQLYDLIIIPFGSFSLLSDELVADSLTNLKLALKEDGKILLTIVTKSDTINEIINWKETNRIQCDQEVIIEYRKVEFNKETSLLNST
ncbi:cyclopropane fatty-acyl-phospholipid synthase-like methyltransferase [Metabacillus crassostreae]|nr:cyclopropane fatty-acyl-phospholipid synthase-like methyltransferase [Metabacillus crassostreae]